MPNPAAAPDSDMRKALDDYYHLKAALVHESQA